MMWWCHIRDDFQGKECLYLSRIVRRAFEEEVMFELPLNGLGVYLPVKGQGELVGR